MAKKGDENDDKSDLLIFGYACKLFRDDERALIIDNEQHLIPWMDNETIKIDRYDGRGALYDLTAHEAVPGAWDHLSSEEQELEDMCDQERYRSLYMNEVEELTYKEEHLKRLQQQSQEYGQVAYDYGSSPASVPLSAVGEHEDVVPSKPYIPPPELKVPSELKLPETVKHSAIIERTALFIAQQGSQMEILMKLKQHGNKNFDFLSHNDPLYEFYKHVLAMIKTGSYVPTTQEHIFEEVPPQEEKSRSFEGDEELGDHYLHPSLVPRSADREVPPPPSSAPSPDKTKLAFSGPPELIKNVIRRMVTYVIRNGPAFERAIMRKKDVRFDFIKSSNQYNVFYRKTLIEEQKTHNEQLLKKEKEKEKTKNNDKLTPCNQEVLSNPSSDITGNAADDSQDGSKTLKKRPLPVNFSIKKPKENKGLEVPSALPVEESSDEEETNNSGVTSPKQGGSSKHSSDDRNQETSDDLDYVNPLSKRLKRSAETISSNSSSSSGSSSMRLSRKHHKHSSSTKKDSVLQSERKLKVAQFLKDLKKKAL